MRAARTWVGWLPGSVVALALALGAGGSGAGSRLAAAEDASPPAAGPLAPVAPAPAPAAPAPSPAPAAPPSPDAAPAVPVVRLALDRAVAKKLLTVAGEKPASYERVDLVLTNRTDEVLHLDLSGHHLRPTTSGCQRLGLSHPVTPTEPAPSPAPAPPPAGPSVTSAATPSGVAPLDLAPHETRRVRMNTCCMDAGRPCPREGDRFELAAAPTPPNVEVALRWWTDHPTAPQGFVNQSIWCGDLRLLSRPFDREAPNGAREPIAPKGRRIRSYGGTIYTLQDGVLTSLDAEGVRRFHGTQIWDVYPRADALYGIGSGLEGYDLWRFAATGEPPWGKVFPVGGVTELLDLVPVPGGAFLTRSEKDALQWRASKDVEPSTSLLSAKATRFTLGPSDAAKGRYVAVVHQAGTPKAGPEAVGPGALSAVSSKFAVMDVDGRTGSATVRKLYWNVRDMAAGPGGVFALSPVGTPERLDGEKLRRIPCADEFDAIVLVGKAQLVLRDKTGRLVAFQVATGRTSVLPIAADSTASTTLSIDPVTDDLVWVADEGFQRWRFGAAEVETIP